MGGHSNGVSSNCHLKGAVRTFECEAVFVGTPPGCHARNCETASLLAEQLVEKMFRPCYLATVAKEPIPCLRDRQRGATSAPRLLTIASSEVG
jgi:hypothetical protein